MTDSQPIKIRFSEYVRKEIEKGNFYAARPCTWHTIGLIAAHSFNIHFYKTNFRTKKVVKLSRRSVENYRLIDINITKDEQKMLWAMQDIAVKMYNEKQKIKEEQHKKEIEALEWWP